MQEIWLGRKNRPTIFPANLGRLVCVVAKCCVAGSPVRAERAPQPVPGHPSLNYSRFCWQKKKRCSKRLMNTGFSKNPAFSFGAPKNDILLYTTALLFLLQ